MQSPSPSPFLSLFRAPLVFSVLPSSFDPVLYKLRSPGRLVVVPRLYLSKTRYSLDRYASRLSLFCLSNTHSPASRDVGEKRPLCSAAAAAATATTRQLARRLATAFALLSRRLFSSRTSLDLSVDRRSTSRRISSSNSSSPGRVKNACKVARPIKPRGSSCG